MDWSYGITAVPERYKYPLPRTLESLAEAGFTSPRIFIDGDKNPPKWIADRYHVSCRWPRIRTFGNWVLALWELYVRKPHADRYAIFQDDLIAYRNLRQFVESCEYPERGYLNLYTAPKNERNRSGWFASNQRGLGAVALVFSNEAVRVLLSQKRMANRPRNRHRGHKAIDGGIVTAFRSAGWREYVHMPTLTQHTGNDSSMGNPFHAKPRTFRGEDFDALSLVRPTPPARPKATRRIGLVGYNCRTGLGELNRQIATYADVASWLVKPRPGKQTLAPHPEVDTFVCSQGGRQLRTFVKSVDTILFCETPYYKSLIDVARELGKRIVCVPMQEWMPPRARGWPNDVDLFCCPTKHCFDQFAHLVRCDHFEWPIDVDRFRFIERERCQRFLFVGGNGGYAGRKGAAVIRRALEMWPQMPLTVCSQHPGEWPESVEVLGEMATNAELYRHGDVLICPHSVDGLGLEPLEAMAAGMPVVTTDGRPWEEWPAISRIRAASSKRKFRRPVTWYDPDPAHLVEICQQLLGQSIVGESRSARHWAESRSWSDRADAFTRLVRGQ